MSTITQLFADFFSPFLVRKEILQQGRNKRVLHELDIMNKYNANVTTAKQNTWAHLSLTCLGFWSNKLKNLKLALD